MQVYFAIKSILLGCPREKIGLKQREEINIFILHLLTIQYEIEIQYKKHGNLHKDASDTTTSLIIAVNPRFRTKVVLFFT
jgi:hypothetical protein